jgi:TolA-binding protein
MRELNTHYLKLSTRRILSNPILWFQVLWILGFLILTLVFMPGAVADSKVVIEKISIQGKPLALEFFVSGQVPVKVIKIEAREVLVALKNAALSQGFKVMNEKSPAIDEISVETLDGDVVAVVVKTKGLVGPVSSGFNTSLDRFLVNLEGPRRSETPAPMSAKKSLTQPTQKITAVKALPGKETTQEASEVSPEPKAVPAPPPAQTQPKPESRVKVSPKQEKRAEVLPPPTYVPPNRVKGEFNGDISDLYRMVERLECESKQIENAILLIRKELYAKAFDLLDEYISRENFSCIEQAHYLRAYGYYKSISDEDYTHLLTAERMFQDVMVSFPTSDLLPFAYTAIGMINTALKNNAAAEGYLSIVNQGYPQYPGMPEVHYYLAEIYTDKGYTDKALGYYKQVFESPFENAYIADAGVGYGRALFEKRQYFDALAIFNYVVERDVKRVYASPELLLNMGQANFELGMSAAARQNFMRVLNLFPDIPDKDVVLSKAGDAYGMENNSDKAVKIYELVREKFPDSQGYVNASIGIARYLKTDPEKIEIYEMIKQKFPENTYARIAMMRLAEIYQKNKEYNKCIKEIEDLLSTHPRGLRYEAVKLMQKAYEALFKEQLKADEYTLILNRYESEHTKLDKMGSREIAFFVGTSYLRAGLYEPAFNHLINAYKQYKRSARSPELLFGLGVAMDESARDDDAVKLFAAFTKRFPKDKQRARALIRMGDIYSEKNRFKDAVEKFKRAYALSADPLEKGKILLDQADLYERQKDLKTAANLRAGAVKEFAAASGKNYDIQADAYKTLGTTYLSLESYVQAADAFLKALNFSTGDRAKANLGFLLGDAYQKSNRIKQAKDAFEQVAGNDDSVWARLARQRLTTLELAETVINS